MGSFMTNHARSHLRAATGKSVLDPDSDRRRRERARRATYRERQRNGEVVLPVRAHEVRLAETLIAHGMLDRAAFEVDDSEASRRALADAAAKALLTLITAHELGL
jgi:hypothetical protein